MKKCCNNCDFLQIDHDNTRPYECRELNVYIQDTYYSPDDNFNIFDPEKFVCPSFSLKKKLNKKRPDEM